MPRKVTQQPLKAKTTQRRIGEVSPRTRAGRGWATYSARMHCWKHTNSSVPLKIRPHLLCLLYLKKEKYRNAFLWCSTRQAGLAPKPIGINGKTCTDTSGLAGQSSSPPAGLQKGSPVRKSTGTHTQTHFGSQISCGGGRGPAVSNLLSLNEFSQEPG